tara:strand:+ start:10133 stop:10984 length:852 start_codon:yes stop_codon:yes gene_type:complete
MGNSPHRPRLPDLNARCGDSDFAFVPGRRLLTCVRDDPSMLQAMHDNREVCAFHHPEFGTLPTAIDLRQSFSFDVYDQGELGSCTANALAAAYRFDAVNNSFAPSRLFIYYNERARENTVQTDAGASLLDGIASLKRVGVCDETIWPYDIDRFADRPSDEAYQAAQPHKSVLARHQPPTVEGVKKTLLLGYPVVFAVDIFRGIDDAEDTGRVPMPLPNEASIGGHALLAVGYNDATQSVIFRNSWGCAWGDRGHGYLPYAYFAKYAHSVWVIQKTTDDAADYF